MSIDIDMKYSNYERSFPVLFVQLNIVNHHGISCMLMATFVGMNGIRFTMKHHEKYAEYWWLNKFDLNPFLLHRLPFCSLYHLPKKSSAHKLVLFRLNRRLNCNYYLLLNWIKFYSLMVLQYVTYNCCRYNG